MRVSCQWSEIVRMTETVVSDAVKEADQMLLSIHPMVSSKCNGIYLSCVPSLHALASWDRMHLIKV